MWRFLARTACVCIFIVFFAQCGTSDNQPGEQAQIPASATTVTFEGTTWSDVDFKHAEHSDRYHGECIKCHDHEPIAGKTHWYCRACHTAGTDAEKLCSPVQDHGCIMTQCDTCHLKQDPSGGQPLRQNCMRCHTGGQLSGVDTQAPSVPAGLTATVVSPSQIDLSWNTSTDNMGAPSYKIYRNVVFLKPVAAGGTSTTSDTGLSASTQYCYRVSAVDAANNESAQSTEVCATTLPDTESPTVPTELSAVVELSGETTLSWTESSDNVAVTGYKIYRNGSWLKDVLSGTLTTDATSNTFYCYRVSAVDGSGHESNMSTQACASSLVASGTVYGGPPYGGTPSLTLKGVIDPWYKIDHWTLTLSTSGTIAINVQAWEGDTSTCCIDYFGDSIINNNRLQSNIHLFKQDGTLVGSSAGAYAGHASGLIEPSPRGRNPYLSIVNIPAGTYVLMIGNCFLSSTDAWNDGTKRYPEPGSLNTDDSVCGSRPYMIYDSTLGLDIYHKYNINIYFN